VTAPSSITIYRLSADHLYLIDAANSDRGLFDPDQADHLVGTIYNDELIGGPGGDILDGGIGNDMASYRHATGAVVANLGSPSANTGDAAGDTYNSIEGLIGSMFGDTLVGDGQANTLNGLAGPDYLTGGRLSDTFVFDSVALKDATAANPIIDHVKDYDQGNSIYHTYSATEGDKIDVSSLFQAAYVHGTLQSTDVLVRAVENLSGTGAALMIDTDGFYNGTHWTTIAQLDGLHIGDTVNVMVDPSHTAGSAIHVSGQYFML
jgi:Ca2+-binding RTX toxin-like protein